LTVGACHEAILNLVFGPIGRQLEERLLQLHPTHRNTPARR
jgi:hypothetical protein